MKLLRGLRGIGDDLLSAERGLALTLQRGKGAARSGLTDAQIRQGSPQGIYTSAFAGIAPRKISPQFLEVLREAIPVIDGGINRLISLLGQVVVEGENGKLMAEVEDFVQNVPVNGFEVGMQAFFRNVMGETFEQGFGLGEYVMEKGGRDVAGLWVADSKDLYFTKDDKGVYQMYARPHVLPKTSFNPTGQLQSVISGTWNSAGFFMSGSPGVSDVALGMDNKVYFSINNENQDPYGTTIMRPLPFVGKLMATIMNSEMSVIERFGDPMYHVKYKAGKSIKDAGMLNTRKKGITDDFNALIAAKRAGRSGDFVTATDLDSDVDVKVIGSDNKEIGFEIPMQGAFEMVCAAFGLAPWMLALHYSTTQGMAEQEVEMMLMDAAIRKAPFLPRLNAIVAAMLRARGRTWKQGDWKINVQSPHLHDLMKLAQARFLDAQAQMMAGGGQAPTQTQVSLGADAGDMRIKITPASPLPVVGRDAPGALKLRAKLAKYREHWHKDCGCHDSIEGMKDRSPEALQVMADYQAVLEAGWSKTLGRVLGTLGLPVPEDDKSVSGKAVTFTESDYARVEEAVNRFVDEMTSNARDNQGAVVTYTGRAHALGFVQAAKELGKDGPTLDLLKNQAIFDELLSSGFALVKDNATLAYQTDIMEAMRAGMERGSNPKEIARTLSRLFTDKNSDWERLARSEVALAQEIGKRNEWAEWGQKRLHFSPAPGACPACASLAGDYDINKCPLPVLDTHPNCTCATTLA
ncbi:MAG: hypothetical protein HZA22_04655 [Nitrospirae bacterium]|nr:hypothetical protein [Nitrospirota bacterium]